MPGFNKGNRGIGGPPRPEKANVCCAVGESRSPLQEILNLAESCLDIAVCAEIARIAKQALVKDCGRVAFYMSNDSRGRKYYFCEAHREQARQVARTRVAISDKYHGEKEYETKQYDGMALNKKVMKACANGSR